MKEFYYLKIKSERYVQYVIFTIDVQTYVHGHKYRSTANFLVREDKIFQHLLCVCMRVYVIFFLDAIKIVRQRDCVNSCKKWKKFTKFLKLGSTAVFRNNCV